MKRILFPVFLLFYVPVFSQWVGPDLANKIYYSKGFVGIGGNPDFRFHVRGADDKPFLVAESTDATFSFVRHWFELKPKSTFANTPYISWFTPLGVRQAFLGWRTDSFGLTLENGFNFSINGGNVGIGTVDTKGYMLAVAGKAVAEEIVVKLKANWPDYVFKSDYRLPPLEEVMDYIHANKHLPEMPSEEQVKAEGINVNDVTVLLLKKIEELTLYAIQEHEKSEALTDRIGLLEMKLRDKRKRK